MDTFDAIRERRSIKHYDTEHRMSEAEVEELIQLAIQSPTSFNMQNWRFVVVSDADVKRAIRAASWDQAHVSDASIVILLCADLQAHAKEPERYWKDAPKEASDILVPMITPFYEGKAQLQRDEAMRSCGIAGQTIMLAAKAMGYDSCPMIGFDPDKVSEIINLPADHCLCFMITVGKGIKEAWPKPGQLPLSDVLIKDKF